MARRKLTLGAAALVLAGCSNDLKVTPLDPDSSAPATGVVYSLPFARYKISVTRTFRSCEVKGAGASFEFDFSFSAAQIFEPDPVHTYTIDTRSLSDWLKSSEFSWELHENGMLKTVGVSAQDKTGEVITNAVTGATKIAQSVLTASAIGALSMMQKKDPIENLIACDPGINNLRASLPVLRRNVNTAKDQLEADVNRLKAMTDTIGAFGKAPIDAIQREAFDQAKQVARSAERLTATSNALKNALDKLSIVNTFIWPDDGRTFVGEDASFNANELKRWLLQNTRTRKAAVEALNLQHKSIIEMRILPLSGLSVLSRKAIEDSSTPGKPDLPTSTVGLEYEGIRYRRAVPGLLEVRACSEVDDPSAQSDQSKSNADPRRATDTNTPTNSAGPAKPTTFSCPSAKLKKTTLAEGPVPQLGRLMLIPFHNSPFQDNALDLTFGADGTMVSGKYQEKAARAVAATSTLKDAAGILLQAAKELPLTKSQAELAELEAETKVLQARDEAKRALEPTGFEENDRAIAIMKSDTSLLEAEIAKLKAQKALDELKKVSSE
jgi:hypothetical protein